MFIVYKYELLEAKRERLLLCITCIIVGSVPLGMTRLKRDSQTSQNPEYSYMAISSANPSVRF